MNASKYHIAQNWKCYVTLKSIEIWVMLWYNRENGKRLPRAR